MRIKRLLYLPGIISLIGLSVALPLFYKKNLPVKEYCLTLFVPNDDNDKNSSRYLFSNYNLEKEILKKKKINFKLNDDREENKRKIKMIKYEALKLKYTEDTSTVVLINLADGASYGEFITIVDMCYADGHKRFAPWDNKFAIFGEWPTVKKQAIDTIQLLSCGSMSFKEAAAQRGFLDLLSKKINKLYTPQGFYLLLGWIVLLLTFLIFKRRNSILQKN